MQHCKEVQDLTWGERNFDKVYVEFIKDQNLNNGQNIGRRGDGYNWVNIGQPTGTQGILVHAHNRGLDLWDYLLLQCCINSLFGGHTTNVTNINYGNNSR